MHLRVTPKPNFLSSAIEGDPPREAGRKRVSRPQSPLWGVTSAARRTPLAQRRPLGSPDRNAQPTQQHQRGLQRVPVPHPLGEAEEPPEHVRQGLPVPAGHPEAGERPRCRAHSCTVRPGPRGRSGAGDASVMRSACEWSACMQVDAEADAETGAPVDACPTCTQVDQEGPPAPCPPGF